MFKLINPKSLNGPLNTINVDISEIGMFPHFLCNPERSIIDLSSAAY